jgi:hypothetical protein
MSLEYFDYPVGSTLTNGGSNGGANWSGAWQVTSSKHNSLIDAGNLAFNDPATHYVDDTEGHHLGARRKQIEMHRTFSATPVATPVWLSCLVHNLQDMTPAGELHANVQRWQIHPNNLADTYLRVGEGVTEYSRFVANGTSSDLDVPVDLGSGTYLVIMRLETDVSANNDSVKAWIIPSGTPIGGPTETGLGPPNLVKDDAPLWADGLTSVGFVGDAHQNQDHTAAQIDDIRVSFSAGSTSDELLAALLSRSAGDGGGVSNAPSSVLLYGIQADAGTVRVEYDETAGWQPGGVVFETATSLVAGEWTDIRPAVEMIDRWDDLITSLVYLPLDASSNRFYRMF